MLLRKYNVSINDVNNFHELLALSSFSIEKLWIHFFTKPKMAFSMEISNDHLNGYILKNKNAYNFFLFIHSFCALKITL